MKDEIIKCVCGKEFVFTAGEQEFYAQRNYDKPKRCYQCRLDKKKQFQDDRKYK